ncbi:phosphoribosyl-AMP cyclohydrolase [Ensifer adhaerens]|uniref:phosphoribosyl-AMP cyclohydrolase n=1 Tax=Ensifer adhaerens TaxID=106592 RepID=UPI001CBC8A6B|nr:phosphoribosyl-AMP cyclohydrolase [Ensifer adhaerens]MBZ7921312.1 phosphoribosyl-AMP cyclohydrolase [Ensifer adhaerens]UAX93743.1 phosphoribosyl-AMP cyclohydrolase [Ensifer adhaerens]UAY01379.1 phosphoribosyl-AMP cyclohydrolase [Ensifer adhaerens]UAY08761.1 phosphoribosyl-AMP cyclohydrolase [Ensifer adhaerens]
MTLTFDAPSSNKAELETGPAFTPRFDEKGLITAVVTDVRDGELLMVAHMNAEALALTIETGVAHYYSRSRKSLWKKGESSGNLQTVKEIRTDCDQDAIWLKVSVGGHDATCHTGRRSCFYRTVGAENGKATVEITDDHRHFDPAEIYDKN